MTETSPKLRIKRVETIHYVKDYTLDELRALGLDDEALREMGVRGGLKHEVEYDERFHDALVEDTERHGDVQGSTFEIEVLE